MERKWGGGGGGRKEAVAAAVGRQLVLTWPRPGLHSIVAFPEHPQFLNTLGRKGRKAKAQIDPGRQIPNLTGTEDGETNFFINIRGAAASPRLQCRDSLLQKKPAQSIKQPKQLTKAREVETY